MIYHYPRWLLVSSLGLLLAACYGWIASHQWPAAFYAVGTTILVAFLLQSNAFLTDESKRLDANQVKLISAFEYMKERLHVHHPEEADPATSPRMVRPVVIPPGTSIGPDGLPIPLPVKLGTEDRLERARNTEALQKDTAAVDRLSDVIEKKIP